MNGPKANGHGPGPLEGAGRSGPRQGYPGPLAYAGIGLLNAFCLLGGLALGWLADSAMGTLPLFLMIGLAFGGATGVVATRAELRRYGR
jgi:hypothetical protein